MASAPKSLRSTAPVERNTFEAKVVSSLAAGKLQAAALQKQGAEMYESAKTRAAQAAKTTKDTSVALATDRRVQVTAASATTGAAVVGAGGAATGVLTGGSLGAAVGLLMAPLTLGLSIPVGATIGGACGFAVGGAAGATAGLTGAGAVGYGAFTKRAEIQCFFAKVQTKFNKAKVAAVNRAERTQRQLVSAFFAFRDHVVTHVVSVRGKAARNRELLMKKAALATKGARTKTAALASDRAAQVTAASAAGGATLLGAGGAASGLAFGGATGAAVGVVPALFTFGLSIPFCAAVGGACGFAAGAAAGSTVGACVGGASGYSVFTQREAIGSTASKIASKLDGAANSVKETASVSAGFVRAKVVGATGGSD